MDSTIPFDYTSPRPKVKRFSKKNSPKKPSQRGKSLRAPGQNDTREKNFPKIINSYFTGPNPLFSENLKTFPWQNAPWPYNEFTGWGKSISKTSQNNPNAFAGILNSRSVNRYDFRAWRDFRVYSRLRARPFFVPWRKRLAFFFRFLKGPSMNSPQTRTNFKYNKRNWLLYESRIIRRCK